MDLLLDFPLTTLFLIVVTVWVARAVARRRRRPDTSAGPEVGTGGAACLQCGAAMPPVARFCHNCGRRV